MRSYALTVPRWVQMASPKRVWSVATKLDEIYLTFDDGPTPGVTEWVLDLLYRYEQDATFFLIGKNVKEHRSIADKILAASPRSHAIGNHTHNHLNGFETETMEYLRNTEQAADVIDSKLFRPPYGRLKRAQAVRLRHAGYKIIMWSVLSGDFDVSADPEELLRKLKKNTRPGSIVVFHDSIKAQSNLEYMLPKYLEFLQQYNIKSRSLARL